MTTDSDRKIPETPFGVRLRAARKMAGLSLEDLAGKLGGRVTKQALSKYETGRMMPSPEVLERLVEVLKEATWGASPLSAEDAAAERQLPLESPMLLRESLGVPRLAFRRQGLLKRLLKDKGPDRDEDGEKDAASRGVAHEDGPLDLRDRGDEVVRRNVLFSVSWAHEDVRPTGAAGLSPLAARRDRLFAAFRSGASLDAIEFRAGEKLAAKAREALKYRVADHLRRYLELESVLGMAVGFENPVAGRRVGTDEEVEAAATEVRERWELGAGPVVNLLGLLEDRGIRVCETRGIEGFEGLSGRFGSLPFIAVSLDFPADRVRFTAAHELGHVLCGFAGPEGPEGRCHAFGAAFLMPRSALERAMAGPGRKVTLGELAEIKETFGVSLQAIMYRGHALGLVTDRRLRAFREAIKARGWDVEEPVAYSGRERATRFRRLLRYAVAEGIMGAARAAEIGGLPVEEIEKDIGEVF